MSETRSTELTGVRIVATAWIPEFTEMAVEDADERLRAMTLHHIDLSLLDLAEPSRNVVLMNNAYYAHPETVKRLCAPAALTRTAP